MSIENDKLANRDRRNFMAKAAKAAVIVPPAMTVLLSTTMASPAIAGSGGSKDWGEKSSKRKHKHKRKGRD